MQELHVQVSHIPSHATHYAFIKYKGTTMQHRPWQGITGVVPSPTTPHRDAIVLSHTQPVAHTLYTVKWLQALNAPLPIFVHAWESQNRRNGRNILRVLLNIGTSQLQQRHG